jgi:uncharacterized protein (TIGR03437 family)
MKNSMGRRLIVCGAVIVALIIVRSWYQRANTPPPASVPTVSEATTAQRQEAAMLRTPRPDAARVLRNKRTFAPQPDWTTLRGKLTEEKGERHERYDQPDKAAEYYRLRRLPPGASDVPVERYLEAQEQMRQMKRYDSARNWWLPPVAEAQQEAQPESLGAWSSLGPGNVGGRVRALLIHPTTPNVMYTAGVSGGVWRTENGGQSWQPLTDLLANLAVCSLAMDPKNPQVLYAGTGEGFFNVGSIRGAGIFRSLDGGNTWQQLSSTNTADFYYVNDLVVSPLDSQRLYAATETGIWRSLNAGGTWSRMFDPDVNGGALDLVIRTDQTTDYLFAACGTFEQATVYRNTNAVGGGSWEKVLAEPNMGRTSLALAPSNQNVIYAAAAWTDGTGKSADEGRLRAVWRSSTSGEAGSWTTQISGAEAGRPGSLLFTNPIAASLNSCGVDYDDEQVHQGWFDNVISVDPTDENRVWVGGIDLFRSDDGGRNWGLASYWWTAKTSSAYAHADHHVIAFHPGYNGTTNRQMFVGTDGGIFRTDDARAAVATGATATCNPRNTQVKWVSLNQGLAVTQFYHGLPLPNGQSYFGGTQDNGTILGTEANGANNWREMHGGDGGYVVVDPTNPQVLFATNPGGTLVKSTNGGATFSTAMFGLVEYDALFIAPVVADPSAPQRLWFGGSRLWRSNRGGANWSAASLGPGAVSAIAVAPTDSNTVLAGNAYGGILRSDQALLTDEGTRWNQTTPRQGFVSGLAFDPTNAHIAYATYSTFGGAHVWRTMDGGATWQSIDGFGAGALPDIPVNCIVVDPTNAARLFVGTDMGIFVTTDGGSTWNVENTGFANAVVSSLALQSGQLYAFTYGRGAWRITLGGNVCNATLSAAAQTFSAAGGSGTISVQGGCSWDAVVNDTGAGWLSFTREGNNVQYSVAANTTLKKRTGSLTIAGRSFVVIQEGFQDVTPPTLTITSPAPNETFVTESDQLTISGTASDNVALTFINAENNRGSSAFNNTGTLANWNLTGFRLSPGINTFTITMADSSQNSARAQLNVLYKPQYTRTIVAGGGNPNQQDEGVAAIGTGISPQGIALDQAGNLYLGGQYGGRIRKVTAATGLITTIAGGGEKYEDGPAREVALNSPKFVAADRSGNLYFSEPSIHIVRRVTPAGQVQTVVGSVGNYRNAIGGYDGDGGPAINARLNSPQGITVDHLGNLYIADQGNKRVRRVSPDGVITTVAGNGLDGLSGDGGPATAAPVYPSELAVDAAGNLYIFESSRVRKVDVRTGIITTVAGGGSSTADKLPATQTRYELLKSIAVSEDGTLYLADYRTEKIFRVGADGISRNIASASTPVGLAVDRSGGIYVVEQSTYIVRKLVANATDTVPPVIKFTNPSTNGYHLATIPYVSIEGTATDNLEFTHAMWRNDRGGGGVLDVGVLFSRRGFWQQWNVPLKPGRNVITVTAWDVAGNSSSDVLTVDYVTGVPFATLAGTRVSGYSGDNASGTNAQLWSPESLAVDASGNLYIAERGNHTIRKITPTGTITTFAGTGQLGSSGDGGPATAATLSEPGGLVVDAAGNLYLADTQNHRIRRVAANGIISHFAGTGVPGFSGDGGAAATAQFTAPSGLALDAAGNLFVADTGNNRIRKISPTGIVSTVAGGPIANTAPDGIPATEYPLKAPTAVFIGPTGELFIADTGKRAIRKVGANGILTTAVLGDDSRSNLRTPGQMAFDRNGVLYVTDAKNNGVQMHMPGSGSSGIAIGRGPGFGLDSGALTALNLNQPGGIVFDHSGNMFIADTGNHRVIKVDFRSTATSVSAASYAAQPVAPGSIVSVFGSNLSAVTRAATTLPLPLDIDGTSVRILDATGIQRTAPLFYVSPLQINYQLPEILTPGYVNVTITSNGRPAASEYLFVGTLSPGLFTANQNGKGAAAAAILYFRNGTPRYESSFACDAQGQNCVARQIDLDAGEEVFLELYGTGIRNNSGLTNVVVTVGGVAVPVLYANKQPDFTGLDQVNIRLPKTLAGRGEVDVVLTVDGKAANTVKVNIK